jgi:hypothetical protein
MIFANGFEVKVELNTGDRHSAIWSKIYTAGKPAPSNPELHVICVDFPASGYFEVQCNNGDWVVPQITKILAVPDVVRNEMMAIPKYKRLLLTQNPSTIEAVNSNMCGMGRITL